jgi:hypothetical protein
VDDQIQTLERSSLKFFHYEGRYLSLEVVGGLGVWELGFAGRALKLSGGEFHFSGSPD